MQGIEGNSLFTYAKYVFLSENFACDSEMNGAKGDLLCFGVQQTDQNPANPPDHIRKRTALFKTRKANAKKGLLHCNLLTNATAPFIIRTGAAAPGAPLCKGSCQRS